MLYFSVTCTRCVSNFEKLRIFSRGQDEHCSERTGPSLRCCLCVTHLYSSTTPFCRRLSQRGPLPSGLGRWLLLLWQFYLSVYLPVHTHKTTRQQWGVFQCFQHFVRRYERPRWTKICTEVREQQHQQTYVLHIPQSSR